MNLIKKLFQAYRKNRIHTVLFLSLSFALGIVIGLIYTLRTPFLSGEDFETPSVKEDRFLLLSRGLKTVEYRIKRNDTLFDILHHLGAPLLNISNLIEATKKLYPIRGLKPGSEIKIQLDRKNGAVRHLEYPIDQDTILVVNNSPQGITAYKQEIEFETRLSLIAGKIKTSFLRMQFRPDSVLNWCWILLISLGGILISLWM